MKPVHRRRGAVPHDEPGIESDDSWVEAGGELILAAGFTEAGFPYGTTIDQYRKASVRYEPQAGWARAKHAIERVCSEAFQREVDVGFVKLGGTGLSRDAFRAAVDDGGQEIDVYALVPNRFAAPGYDQRAVFELRLLAALSQRELGIRVPKALGALRDRAGVILIEEVVEGLPLDLRAGRQGTVRPWVVVAEIAAEVHALDLDGLPEGVRRSQDCRAYGESHAASIGRDHPLLRAAAEWMLEHLPPREACVLLHGDLLGQNVHLGFGQPPGVLDWEWAEIGDPAYELAVVTRGVRQPFRLSNGLGQLLDEYSAAGGRPLTPARVAFYELGLLARQFQDARIEAGDVLGAEDRLRGFLKRRGAG